jgi:hypothetical protein
MKQSSIGRFKMKAYTKGITKAQFVAETKAHRQADRFIRGSYGESGDYACAVGCAIKSINKLKSLDLSTSNHLEYEAHLGIPEWVARLEDLLFENMSRDYHTNWPVNFAEAINEGSDLNQVKVPFIVYLMESNLESIRSCKYDEAANPEVKNAIDQTEKAILQMIEAQKSADKNAISAARSAARSAAESAAWAAESAAWAAAESAESAARSAESAARSARSAAWAAAWAAAGSAWAAARSAARSAAESAAFDRHADKLLELMRECK